MIIFMMGLLWYSISLIFGVCGIRNNRKSRSYQTQVTSNYALGQQFLEVETATIVLGALAVPRTAPNAYIDTLPCLHASGT